ncbi:CYFA0S24e01002g1_1 [Cyberlindnera fabianii]|uniref:CYFA0S24e01002g1_1 n=1 Tax=Cyberlindnera fabianii TaxID=36022 RepID=A0A061BI06_CYBFA|nr:CYFA0S24e01002g1_1 [Cyberlindnera fabianii]
MNLDSCYQMIHRPHITASLPVLTTLYTQTEMLRQSTVQVQRQLVRHSSTTSSYSTQISRAREACASSLRQYDKSSYILSAYIPSPARDCFIALRAFNIEVSKITGNEESQVNKKLRSTIGVSSTDLRIKFWEETLYKIFQNPGSDQVVGEPVALLLRDSLRNGLNLDVSYLNQILMSRNEFLKRQQFQTVDELCGYGEGLYSQLNYLVQNLLLSDQLSPSTVALVEESEKLRNLITEIAAHLGQATGVASMVLATEYNAKVQDKVYLPVDVMSRFELSQEDVLRLYQGHLEEDKATKNDVELLLRDVVYETCITANDHLLTARSKLEEVKTTTKEIIKSQSQPLVNQKSGSWKKSLPDCLFVPFMNAVPLSLYLSSLEKHDFDLVKNKIQNPYWKLVSRTFRSYQTRKI